MSLNTPHRLTSSPIGSFGELVTLAIPLILTLLSGNLLGFCDRLFLSRYSVEALQACSITLSLSYLFSSPLVRIVLIIQMFIGKYQGAQELEKIGPSVWQMIWFSLGLSFLTLPLCFYAEHLFFKNTSVAHLGIPYFRLLIPLNFLLPLGASLSAFYVGRGKGRFVLYATIASHSINLILNPFLIFGFKGICPSWGMRGAGIATLIGQSLFCGIQLLDFLKKPNRIIFHTHVWKFQKNLFFEYLKLGIPRSISRSISVLTWTAAVHFLTQKGGLYLLVLSFGSSIQLLYLFIIEGMGQAILIVGSYLVGIKKLNLLRQLVKSALLFLLMGAALLSIPFIVFPDAIIASLLHTSFDPPTLQSLRYTCYWNCALFLALGLNSIGYNLLTAFHDTLFQMIFNGISSWFLTYGAIYYILELQNGSPDKLWPVMIFAATYAAFVYYLRVKRLKARLLVKFDH